METGVPQGSKLGPLLFLIFYNDLPFSLTCEVDAYADDSTLTSTGKTIEDISEGLSLNFEKVCNWMNQNRLKLNTDKTHILTVGTNQKLNTLSSGV